MRGNGVQDEPAMNVEVTRPKPAVPEKTRWLSSRKRTWTNYLYLVPVLVFIIGVFYYGIIYSAYVSLLNWNGISATQTFIGLKNYADIIKDPIFSKAIQNTVIFGVLAIIIQMALGLGLALLLKRPVFLKTVYKIVFFLPVVLASSVTAYVFRHIFDANNGELNHFLDAIGLHALNQAWLADPNLALYSLIAINIWQWTGFSFIMYLAGLTLIDETLYDAARIDGANGIQTVIHITVPLLRPTHYSLVILGVVGALKTFDIVFLTTGGGPGRATEFLSTYIYKKEILEFSAGYASALSIVMLLLALVLTVIQLRAYAKQK
jgi:raffinose/stachyose/melibiose transport system permease protein